MEPRRTNHCRDLRITIIYHCVYCNGYGFRLFFNGRVYRIGSCSSNIEHLGHRYLAVYRANHNAVGFRRLHLYLEPG